jgi:hypothetical protein
MHVREGGSQKTENEPLPNDDKLQLDLTEFLNLYPLRMPRIMWFLGAGSSVTAGLPTAATLTWEFKRAL